MYSLVYRERWLLSRIKKNYVIFISRQFLKRLPPLRCNMREIAIPSLSLFKTIFPSQFFRKPNSVEYSFSEKTIVMERPKTYVSPEYIACRNAKPLRVFASERSNSVPTWIEMLASKTRSSEKSRCRRGCQDKTVAAFKCQAISSVRAWRWISSETIR